MFINCSFRLDERLDFAQLLQGDFASGGDVLARIAKIHPAVVADVGTQNDVGAFATDFGHADLCAVNAVHENLQNISLREIIDVLVERQKFARELERAARGSLGDEFALNLQTGADAVGRGHGIYSDNFVNAHFLQHIHRQRIHDTAVHKRFFADANGHKNPGTAILV